MPTFQVLLEHRKSTVFPTRFREGDSLGLFRTEKMELALENDVAAIGVFEGQNCKKSGIVSIL